MFENPKERQAGKKFYKKYSENSRSQIVFRTDIFRKLTLSAPEKKATGASEVTGQLDIAHLVQSGIDFRPSQLSVNLFEDWRRKML